MEEPVRIDRCNNIGDFRSMARRRLPGPIFHYIDGAADDEVTYRRNTEAYERCDLVPNVLAGVESIDMSITVMGQKIDMPLFCAPTALQRLFHHDGERAVAKAAEKFGTMFGISSLGTISIEEIGSTISTPKLFQLYFHKDRGLTNSMIERCIAANFDVLALTVDTITGGNRERDLRTGFTSPPRLTLNSLLSFAMHPRWAANYFMHEKFELPQLKDSHGSAGRPTGSPSASCRVRFRLGDFQAPFQRRPDPRPPEHTDKVSLPNTPSRPRKGPSRRGCHG